LQRSFEQQPAQFDALHSADPLLLAELLELLDEVLELPLAIPLVLLLDEPMPDVDEATELLELASPVPPAPPEPTPPSKKFSKSLPVAHAAMTKHDAQYKKIFFIWAPEGPRRC
jgi:hypothetical protein